MPPETPWYITALLVPAAVVLWRFCETKVWPYLTKHWETEDTSEADDAKEERQWRHALEERRVRASEVTAQALEQMSRTLTAMDFRIAQIERRTDLHLPATEKIRPRQHTEGERE